MCFFENAMFLSHNVTLIKDNKTCKVYMGSLLYLLPGVRKLCQNQLLTIVIK